MYFQTFVLSLEEEIKTIIKVKRLVQYDEESTRYDGIRHESVRHVQNRLKFRTVFPPNTAHYQLELMYFAERYRTLCRFTCSLERQRQACSKPIYMASCLGVENCSSPVWKRVVPTTPLSSKREY